MVVKAMYVSPTHTTQKTVLAVAQGAAQELGAQVQELNLTLPEDRKGTFTFSKEEILVFGAPVYSGRIPMFTQELFDNLKGNNTPVVLCAVYGNRHYDDALIEMRDLLAQKGFIVFAAGAFIGEHSFTTKLGTSRPDQQDLDKAKDFGVQAAKKLVELEKSPTEQIQVEGNVPYKERMPAPPIAPQTTDACVDCMICAKGCPVGAISFEDPRVADPNKCVKCCACVKACPTKAKTFGEMLQKPVTYLESQFTARREPEFFI